MAVSVEALDRCAVCPARGFCAPCKPLTVRGESGSGGSLAFKGGFKELLSLPRLPDVIDPNLIDFSSVRARSGEPSRISEKTCSECGKQDCSHLKT